MTCEHIGAVLPAHESDRLLALQKANVLDTPPEQVFDSLVQLAQTICDVPIALVSLVDRERQWFKAHVGLDVQETPRDLAFCAHAILTPERMTIVEDAQSDPRFRHSPLVVGPPYIRFYAGAPIVSADGQALGTVCVIDRQTKTLSAAQQAALLAIAHQASVLIGLRTY
jgi:GAF domain-containing protein